MLTFSEYVIEYREDPNIHLSMAETFTPVELKYYIMSYVRSSVTEYPEAKVDPVSITEDLEDGLYEAFQERFSVDLRDEGTYTIAQLLKLQDPEYEPKAEDLAKVQVLGLTLSLKYPPPSVVIH